MMKNVVYLNNMDRKNELAAELERIVVVLKKIRGVEKVILFGSLVDGRLGEKSDIDLIVIQRTEKRFIERCMDLTEAINPKVAVDILAYTPEEFARMQKENNRFIKQALATGRVVYEKRDH